MSKTNPKSCKHLRDFEGKQPEVMSRGGFVPEAIPTQPARQPIALAPTKPVSPKVVATAPKAMLAQEVSKAPRQPWGDEKWIAEVKIDGMRVLLVQAENGPTFYSRSGIRYEYPFLADVQLPAGTILDAELAAPGETSAYATGTRTDLELVVFDVLAVGPISARELSWTDRRAMVEQIVTVLAHPRIRASRVLGTPDKAEAETLMALGVEGVMLKRKASTYQPTRSWDWLKHKFSTTYDVVVVDDKGESVQPGFTGLRYGYFVDGKLVLAGALGHTGPAAEMKAFIGKVVEVKGYGRGDSGAIRHPVFIRVRDDKRPEECELT